MYGMLARPLGGIWRLKDRIEKEESGIVKEVLKRVYQGILKENGCWIGHTAKFEGDPTTPHFNGIFISGRAKIGENCVIHHHVTIGSNKLADSKSMGAPEIGDNCYIGAGATIVGSVKIGNNVRIGAGCVVSSDIPDNSVVVNEKPRVIQKREMNNKFYIKRGPQMWVYKIGKEEITEEDEDIIATLEDKLW